MFIVVSINDSTFQPLGLAFNQDGLRLLMDIDLIGLIAFSIVTLPATFCIANIMLANNITDLEADIPYRYTLPRNIGRRNALYLFAGLYYATYLSIIVASLVGLVPLWCLLTLVTLIPVQKNIRLFFERQIKPDTFVVSVKNFVLIMSVYILSMVIGGVL